MELGSRSEPDIVTVEIIRSLFPPIGRPGRVVAVGALTAARRSEVLALRWIDLDVANKTLTIARALEQTKKHGIRFKEPKTARSKRTFQIDDDLLTLLLAEREKHLRFVAGISNGALVDLSLVKPRRLVLSRKACWENSVWVQVGSKPNEVARMFAIGLMLNS
jgi:integrase